MLKSLRTAALTAILAGAVATPAGAHIGLGDHGGFTHGITHPVSGLDHILAMVAVGVLAAHLGGRALWLVPAAFIGMMAIGGILGFAGVTLPFVEHGIGLSVIVLGALVALDVTMPTMLAMAIVGLFAIFHGHAHGTELPLDSTPSAFAAGFVVATALLHACGIALGMLIQRLAQPSRVWTTRIAGALMAIFGLSLLAQ